MSRAGIAAGAAAVLGALAGVAEAHPTCPGIGLHATCQTHTGMWRPPMLRFELGLETARVPVAPDDATDGSTATFADEGTVETRGVTVRALAGWKWGYTGGEFNLSGIRSAPMVVDTPAGGIARETGALDGRSGLGATCSVIVGAQLVRGPLMLAAEGALGIRAVSIFGPGHVDEDDPGLSIVRPLVETRLRAGVWLTPFVSVSAQAGVGVIRQELTGTLLLGFSAFPWDGLR